MRPKVKYGVMLLGFGILLWISGLPSQFTELMYVSLTTTVIGGVLLYVAYESWYCAACGQFLGRGSRPDRCERCGSNRVTTSDPGAVR